MKEKMMIPYLFDSFSHQRSYIEAFLFSTFFSSTSRSPLGKTEKYNFEIINNTF